MALALDPCQMAITIDRCQMVLDLNIYLFES